MIRSLRNASSNHFYKGNGDSPSVGETFSKTPGVTICYVPPVDFKTGKAKNAKIAPVPN
jgi:hypothetical protein